MDTLYPQKDGEWEGILRWPERRDLGPLEQRMKCLGLDCSECAEAQDCPRAVGQSGGWGRSPSPLSPRIEADEGEAGYLLFGRLGYLGNAVIFPLFIIWLLLICYFVISELSKQYDKIE